jgi:hypothetical protein
MTLVYFLLTSVTKAAPIHSLLLLSIIALKMHPFWPQEEVRKFGRVESRTVDRKLRKTSHIGYDM